jgi:hypothetical protein
MKSTFFLIIFVAFMNVLNGQQYITAHTTITFNDPLRSGGYGSGAGPGRQIQTEIYYPSISGGENASPAEGPFPFIVFGHGYLMTWEAYRNIWDSIVPQGYIMVFLRTESGMLPDHEDFAADFVVCARKFREAGKSASGMFSGKVAEKMAFMGHSLGGGAAFLAGSVYGEATTIIGLAPYETNPPASVAAKLVSQPSLIISGSQDGVTSPTAHHLPIFNNLGSSCKYFISITGGGHCFFACPNTPCDMGEKLVSSSIGITRETQQAIALEYFLPWLNSYLKNSADAKSGFLSLIKSDSRITFREACSLSVHPDIDSGTGGFKIYPNPVCDILFVERPATATVISWKITTLLGSLVNSGSLSGQENSIAIGAIADGAYLVTLTSGSDDFHFRIILQK